MHSRREQQSREGGGREGDNPPDHLPGWNNLINPLESDLIETMPITKAVAVVLLDHCGI